MLTENRSKGVTFARVRIVVDLATGTAVYKTADYHRPWTIGVTPDPTIQARLDALNGELKPILSTVVGTSTVAIPRADACGTDNGRTCESLIGDLIADAMRTTYGTDFAITNSGGIRADLTCPAEGNDFCPTDPAEITITRGQVLTVLPFGNVVITETVTGAELKAMLENGVAAMPEPDGGFPQVSGLCFTYDLTADPGARVISTVRQRADGSCTGDQIDFSEDVTYTLATNDFISVGGDGYPITADPGVSRDVLEQDVAEYIAATSPLEPVLEGRITCVGDGCPAIAS
jgi:2',3'-cyclic-nucleotide 2'-phosphodiesterase (5'-nucleotidase family)